MAEPTTTSPAPAAAVEALAQRDELDPYVDRLYEAIPSELKEGPLRRLVGGGPLGHSLHPLLTDLPIGFWTSSWVLDLVPSKRTDPAATFFIALGLVSAVPTIVTGLSDWSALEEREDQRVGYVHAVANGAAFGLYALSLGARLRGRRKTGLALGHLGAAAATLGGHLGGHLVIERGAAKEASQQALAQPNGTPA